MSTISNMTNSPRRKEAARTIKRIIIKKNTQKHYKNFTVVGYLNIKTGHNPLAARSLFRRMHMYPVRVNAPIYRGMRRPERIQKLNGPNGLTNSFASFSTNNKIAKRFATNNAHGFVLVLEPGKYPAINSSKFGGGSLSKTEQEVTLAPGKYFRNSEKPITYRNYNLNNNLIKNIPFIPVKYIPSKNIVYI